MKWLLEDPVAHLIVMAGLATVGVLVAFLIAVFVSL